jgi:cell shape-determining protein MreC
MARYLTRPQKAFAVALATIVALAFTPSRWLGWTRDVADVVNLPLTPMRDAGVALAKWLRRPPPLDGSNEIERELLQQRDEFERLYHVASGRVRELEDHIEQLQQIPPDNPYVATHSMIANITGGNQRAPWDAVEVNRGARHGVAGGTIALYGGVHLVGRITGVSPLRSELLPLPSRATGPINARLLPAGGHERAVVPMTAGELVQLEPRGDGTLIAHVRIEHSVANGDVLRLDDHTWPPAAQAMIIGQVASIERNDRQPLMRVIVVRPRFHVHQLRAVALRIEGDESRAAGVDRGALR